MTVSAQPQQLVSGVTLHTPRPTRVPWTLALTSLRYILRSPLAQERLALLPDHRVRLALNAIGLMAPTPSRWSPWPFGALAIFGEISCLTVALLIVPATLGDAGAAVPIWNQPAPWASKEMRNRSVPALN